MPELSVIIPAFRPNDFAALRQSMADNEDCDAEWIVVDDGSGPEYSADFAGLSDTPARVIRLPINSGQSVARNAGLERARGQWVKFLDADDRLDEGHLSALLAAALPGGAIPFAPTRHLFPRGGTSLNDSWHDLPADSGAQLARMLHRPFLSHCGALFPRALLRNLGGYDESLVTDEDGDLLIRVLMTGAHFLPVPQVQYLYIHHQGDGRMSSDAGQIKLAARLRVCDKVESAFAERGEIMPDHIRRALALRLDKIGLTWWQEDRAGAQAVLHRARSICPQYQSEARWLVQMLRRIGGPSAIVNAARLYRRLRGRPAGGAQG